MQQQLLSPELPEQLFKVSSLLPQIRNALTLLAHSDNDSTPLLRQLYILFLQLKQAHRVLLICFASFSFLSGYPRKRRTSSCWSPSKQRLLR